MPFKFVDSAYGGTSRSKTGEYDEGVAEGIIQAAVRNRIDPYLAGGVAMQESNLGMASPNPFQLMMHRKGVPVHQPNVEVLMDKYFADLAYPRQNELAEIGKQVHAVQNAGLIDKVRNWLAGRNKEWEMAQASRASELENELARTPREAEYRATGDIAMNRLRNLLTSQGPVEGLRSYRVERGKNRMDKIGKEYPSRVQGFSNDLRNNEFFRSLVERYAR